MPIDAREKRQSAYSLLVPSLTPGIEPSSIDQAERQAAAWMYSGILAAALAAVHTVTFGVQTSAETGLDVLGERETTGAVESRRTASLDVIR